MPGALVAPDQTEIDTWGIEEEGVKDGSSPTVTFSADGSIATRKVFCLWQYRYKVAKWFVGAVSSYLDGSTARLSRLMPQQLPDPDPDEVTPDWPDFFAVRVTEMTGHVWEGNDPDDPDEYQFTDATVNRFTHAKLTIQYERIPYTLMDDVEITTTELDRFVQYVPEDGQVDYVTVPASTQRYISSTGTGTGHDVPVPYPVGITEGVFKFCLRWHRIPYTAYGPGSALWARIFGDGTTANLPFLNAVNDAPFYFDTFPAGTCMLERVTERLDPTLLDSGPYLWTIDYHFAVKPAGWNTSWFFPNTSEFTGAGNAAKRMLVGRGSTYYAPGSVPDLYSNYIARNLDLLFVIDD